MSVSQTEDTKQSNTLAIIALILAIIGVIVNLISLCFASPIGIIFGIVDSIAAIVISLIARKKIKSQGADPSQLKIANAALIIGIIGGILSLINLAILLITSLVLAGPAIEDLFQDVLEQIENQ